MAVLTPALIETVMGEIQRFGYYPEQVIISEMVTRREARAWLREGRRCEQMAERPPVGSHSELCLSLVTQVDHAEARIMNVWQDAWTAACIVATETGKGAGATAWMQRLERRFPDQFKLRTAADQKAAVPAPAYDDVARRRAEKAKEASSE